MSVIYDPNKIVPKKPRRAKAKPAAPKLRVPSWRFPRRPPTPGVSSQAWVVMAVLIVIGLGYVTKNYLINPAPAPSSTTSLAPDQERIEPERSYLSLSDASSSKRLKLSFIAPKAWRTTRLKADNSVLLGPKDYQVGLFAFAAGSSLEATGQLSIENVDAWIEGNPARQG